MGEAFVMRIVHKTFVVGARAHPHVLAIHLHRRFPESQMVPRSERTHRQPLRVTHILRASEQI